jgi:4-amino-4-deoxy-L-arabinose transferase-like glycosyltransferase
MKTGSPLKWMGPVLLCGALATVRLVGLGIYPRLAIDEGLWTLQTKDAVLFGDASMNGLRQVFLSPLHFAVTWLLFHILPATLFSIRFWSGLVGLGSLAVIWGVVRKRHGGAAAWGSVVLIGLSFSLVTINRRAYLESGVILISMAAFYCSMRSGRLRSVGLATLVAALLLYKLNSIYFLPCLLWPNSPRQAWRETGGRLLVVLGGVAAAILVYFAIYETHQSAFAGAWLFELNKSATGSALVHIGRFGIYPSALLDSARSIVFSLQDLTVLSLIALVGLALVPAARDPYGWKLAVWLVSGYLFLSVQSFQHLQYFVPLIAPAGMLAFHVVRSMERDFARQAAVCALAILTVVGLGRIGWGVIRAQVDNPQLSALRWIESSIPPGGACLATAELAAATEHRCYAYNRVFHPYGSVGAPALADFVREKHVASIVVDEWETTPAFAGDRRVLSALTAFRVVRVGDHWRGLAVAPEKLTDGSVSLLLD